MKIKILNINNALPDINGTSKKGFLYTVKHWNCNIEINGKQAQNIEVKTMDKNLALELKEYEVEEKNYNGILSYQIVKQSTWKKGGSGYSNTIYTRQEYDALWNHAFNMVFPFVKNVPDMFNRLQVTSSMMATYIISATKAGVKIDGVLNQPDKKPDNNQASDLQKPEYQQKGKQFLDKHKDDQDNLHFDPDEDNDIPF
jgi:hypothetical protein